MLGFIVLSTFMVAIFSNGVLSDGAGSAIPTKEDQIKILKNLEELFKEVEILVTEEGVATDAAVLKDTQTTVDRGLEYLAIMEDFALLKLSCSLPEANCDNVKKEIEGVAREAETSLHYCANEAAASVVNNTQVVTTATDDAMLKGKLIMDTLHKCSKKPGLHQVTCYKKVMTSDVFPLKPILLDTMHIHKTGHLESIGIRNKAKECVDEALTICHNKIAKILSNANDMCT